MRSLHHRFWWPTEQRSVARAVKFATAAQFFSDALSNTLCSLAACDLCQIQQIPDLPNCTTETFEELTASYWLSGYSVTIHPRQ